MSVTDAQAQDVFNRLAAKGAKLDCDRCDAGRLVVGGFTFVPNKDAAQDFELTGPAVGAVTLACGNCGHLEFHSTKVLGLNV